MLTLEKRNDLLKTLYWNLWTSADFESNFESEWGAVYNALQEGRESEIPDNILLMINKWVNEQKETF